ncbi:MAG: hypothetical protein RI995_1005 [Bacteroidota bacterium]|jgi:hypothetical protein
MRQLLLFLGTVIFLTSCTKKADLTGLDVEKFKSDRGACKGLRSSQIDWLKAHRLDLKGVSSNDIEEELGKPDIQQLADRNQEYYIYFLAPGTHCQDIKKPSTAQSIAFRFSAMGLATEITFQQGTP